MVKNRRAISILSVEDLISNMLKRCIVQQKVDSNFEFIELFNFRDDSKSISRGSFQMQQTVVLSNTFPLSMELTLLGTWLGVGYPVVFLCSVLLTLPSRQGFRWSFCLISRNVKFTSHGLFQEKDLHETNSSLCGILYLIMHCAKEFHVIMLLRLKIRRSIWSIIDGARDKRLSDR